MAADETSSIKVRIEKIRHLGGNDQGTTEFYEAAILAQTVLYDTVGGNHPLMGAIQNALEKGDWARAVAGARGVVTLFDNGELTSPRLAIAHEIEADLLDIAQAQVQATETNQGTHQKQIQLAVAAFLAAPRWRTHCVGSVSRAAFHLIHSAPPSPGSKQLYTSPRSRSK